MMANVKQTIANIMKKKDEPNNEREAQPIDDDMEKVLADPQKEQLPPEPPEKKVSEMFDDESDKTIINIAIETDSQDAVFDTMVFCAKFVEKFGKKSLVMYKIES